LKKNLVVAIKTEEQQFKKAQKRVAGNPLKRPLNRVSCAGDSRRGQNHLYKKGKEQMNAEKATTR